MHMDFPSVAGYVISNAQDHPGTLLFFLLSAFVGFIALLLHKSANLKPSSKGIDFLEEKK